jgi:hypothetical protein
MLLECLHIKTFVYLIWYRRIVVYEWLSVPLGLADGDEQLEALPNPKLGLIAKSVHGQAVGCPKLMPAIRTIWAPTTLYTPFTVAVNCQLFADMATAEWSKLKLRRHVGGRSCHFG